MQPTVAVPLLSIAVIGLLSVFYYLRYSGISRERALALWASTLFLTFGWFLFLLRTRAGEHRMRNEQEALTIISAAICFIIAVPFIVRLWSKWVQGNLTEAERSPGAVGWRAWFSGGNIIAALIIAVLAWKGFMISLPLMLLATFGALAVYPAILSASETPASSSEPPPYPVDNLSTEREKVLSMLEAGKISAEESAELLTALGATVRHAQTMPVAMTSAQRLVLVGAAVLLIGFFLPWLVFNPGKELDHMMGNLTTQMQNMVPPGMPMPQGMPDFQSVTNHGMISPMNVEVQIAGGSVGKGLGWMALCLGLLAALLPYFARAMDYPTQRLVRFLALGGGAAIILYIFTASPRSIGIGLIVAAVGVGLEFIGVSREQRAV
ncbi:MAG: SHOCT-like domain-containing protein [Chthoniobacteraceae bacterium]